MSDLGTVLRGYTGYRGHEGHISFLLHRFTGLGTALFLTIHILDTATVYFFPSLYNHAIGLYQSTLFGMGEVVLIFCVFYHGVNGLRIAFLDLFAPQGWVLPIQRNSAWITMGVTLLLWIPSTVIMVRNLLIHNFGMFGG
ncbi:MAG: succinate dehydrogenase, cytochrome b556 subunit [Chloroflexi bacterium]|jgi:succinate dehydrogenase / fumarate reductase cytochrome b subunit|nr:hypothetical protein [Anaerolineaceae bacterium]NMB89150.1 succinate dehydrogenase, cytochrome b556 subunit [Chloroflexota bacterium]